MGPRKLDAMTDLDYEALKKKLLETYSVRPTLSNPTLKSVVDWHCLESSCFLDTMVFGSRDRWMRHHKRLHNRVCENDGDYPRELEAKQFLQEHELRENARLGIAGAVRSAGVVPPSATPAGPYSRISGALRVTPLNSVVPSSSTSGALFGASPSSAAPNSPRSGAHRTSAAARRRGPRGPYRVRANKDARRQEHPDQSFVNSGGAVKAQPESSGTLDVAEREILMQQLSYNLQAVSQLNTDSVHIMQILGLPSTNFVSEIRRPAGSKRPRESPNTGAQGYPAATVATPVPLPTWVNRRALASTSQTARALQAGQSKFVDAASQAPAHSNEVPAHVFESTPYPRIPSHAPAHSNEGPAHYNQVFALAIGGPAHSYQGPSLSIGLPGHSYEGPPRSIKGPLHLALTPSQPEEEEEEENYNAVSDSEKVLDSDSEDQATDVSQGVYEGQVRWTDVKVEAHAAGSWP